MTACLNRSVVATPAQWLAGARPRTLPAAISPVLAGTGVAAYVDDAVWWKALLALVVSLALQVAVNYANDYSDGIRGTDADRVGPMRLVGSGVASPSSVKRAAFLAFGVAGAAGLVLAASTAWWLVAVGLVSVLAAWFYTGGSRPYGYLGLGEVMVFVFFGLVAVVGTTYVQTETLRAARRCTPRSGSARSPARSWWSTTCATSRPTPWPASAPSPSSSAPTAPGGSTCCSCWPPPRRASRSPSPPPGGRCSGSASSCPPSAALRTVLSGAVGPALVPVLQSTGLAELAWAVLVAVPLVIARLTDSSAVRPSFAAPVQTNPGWAAT